MILTPFVPLFDIEIDEKRVSSFYDAKRITMIHKVSLLNSFFSFLITYLLLFFYQNWEAFFYGNIIAFIVLIPSVFVYKKHYAASKIVFELVLALLGLGLAFLFGKASLAEFLPIFIPIRALLFFKKPKTWLVMLLSFLLLLSIELIYYNFEPLLIIKNPMIMTVAIGAIMTFIGYFLIRMFKEEVLAINDLVLKKNKELEHTYRLIEEKNKDLVNVNEKLNVLNADLQQFASMASHDMREPLRTISNFGSLLRKRSKDDETSQEFLDFIVNAAKRMSGLLDDLIDYARAGIPKDEVRPVDLNDIVLMAQQNLNKLLQESHGAIETVKLPIIVGHQTLFLQLFQNVISNGLKFHQKDTAPIVRVHTEFKETFIVISISDNGIGIEEQFLKKVFEPFLRLHAVGVYEGSGIGLATCKKIMEFYQGRIEIKSALDKGTTFELWLPNNMLKKD